MPDTLTPSAVLQKPEPLVLYAYLEPVARLDRFQPAGFPEVGHVIYKAPRKVGDVENVCIVDSAASMANHLESICMRGAHDYALVDDLEGMPYLRCVTGNLSNGQLPLDNREVVVTSLTEGHRIASTYFLAGTPLMVDGSLEPAPVVSAKAKGSKRKTNATVYAKFEQTLIQQFGIILPDSSRAHPPVEKWWDVFSTIFRYDPNALVHGVLFPQWQIKIPRALTAHLEAFGASRVDRSGVKFDRLGQTTSGQPIFAVDDATAREIRATFILDTALLRSFGRSNKDDVLGLTQNQKEFLVALALWKIQRMLQTPFRFRSGCHLQCVRLTDHEGQDVRIDVDVRRAISAAAFPESSVTDIFWPKDELYRAPAENNSGEKTTEGELDAAGEEPEGD